jgi:hypothetical protein
MNDIISLSVEYTDTYGGESNYSWVIPSKRKIGVRLLPLCAAPKRL